MKKPSLTKVWMEEKFLDLFHATLRAGKTKSEHLEETLPNHPSKVRPSKYMMEVFSRHLAKNTTMGPNQKAPSG